MIHRKNPFSFFNNVKKIYGFKIECDRGQALGRVCHWRSLWIHVCFGSFENLSKMHAIVYDASVSVECQMTIFHSNLFMNERRAMSSKAPSSWSRSWYLQEKKHCHDASCHPAHAGDVGESKLVQQTINLRSCTIMEKAPSRAFSWLKAPTSAFTFKTHLRHYAKRTLTPW